MLIIHLFLSLVSSQGLIVERPIKQLQWCGASIIYTRDDETVPQFQGINDDKTILFLTETHTLYQSNGTIWNKIDGLFEDILISPADSRVVYLIGQPKQQSFRTNNCGETFEKIDTQDFYSFKLNKMNSKWIMAFKKQKCDHFDMDCKEPFNNQLYYSEDGGNNWLSSFKNCREVSWDKIIEDEEVPDQRIIVLQLKDNKTQLIYSDDFKQQQLLMNEAQGYYQTPKYLFILSSSDNGAYELHYGTSILHEYQGNLVELPLQILKEYSYTVLDTDNGRIYLSVSHQQEEQSTTNVYISNTIGKEFKIILTNNVRSTIDGNCDFEKLLGLTSTYVANTFSPGNYEQKTTVISFDGGMRWEKIKAPKIDSEGNQIQCNGECSLHFIGRTESYRQTIYTIDQAPGIVLGVGNVGEYIKEEQNTYMSADGGQNWIEVRKGSHVFEIADFGGLIIMAKDYEPTNEIIYSIDYGKSWQTKIIYDDLFMAQNILTEASGTLHYFIIHGKSDTGDGIVLKLDFSDEFDRDCKPNLDYDIWDSKCIDGSQTKYYRKKIYAQCFNPKSLITRKIIEPCLCKREDWICAPGFVSHIEGGICEPLLNLTNYCEPGKKYFKTRGYAKLTQCVGGLDLGPTEENCPIIYEFQYILLVIVSTIIILVVIICSYRIIRQFFIPEEEQKKVTKYNQMEFEDEEEEEDSKL